MFGVLTVSDRASGGVYRDLSGPAILQFLGEAVHSECAPLSTPAASRPPKKQIVMMHWVPEPPAGSSTPPHGTEADSSLLPRVASWRPQLCVAGTVSEPHRSSPTKFPHTVFSDVSVGFRASAMSSRSRTTHRRGKGMPPLAAR